MSKLKDLDLTLMGEDEGVTLEKTEPANICGFYLKNDSIIHGSHYFIFWIDSYTVVEKLKLFIEHTFISLSHEVILNQHCYLTKGWISRSRWEISWNVFQELNFEAENDKVQTITVFSLFFFPDLNTCY